MVAVKQALIGLGVAGLTAAVTVTAYAPARLCGSPNRKRRPGPTRV